MNRTKTYKANKFQSKITDYGVLIKFKLSLTVVFSAVMAYLIVGGFAATLVGILGLFIGGMLVTGSANALNQVLEAEYDGLMERTKNRPVVQGRISSSEAVLSAGLMCLVGVTILGMFNPLTAFLGMLSLVLYAFVYTPLKRFSPVAILIGTLPGAMPVLIGAVAIEGHISTLALVLFFIQVLWQLPHFLAIGWLGNEDYKKAGYKMLPTKDQKLDSRIGIYAFLTALPLIGLALVPAYLGGVNIYSSIIVLILGIAYSYFAWNFYKKSNRKSALGLMFSSIVYLPLILITYYIGTLI